MLTEKELISFDPAKFDATLVENYDVDLKCELWKLGNKYNGVFVFKVDDDILLMHHSDVLIYDYQSAPILGESSIFAGHFSHTTGKTTKFIYDTYMQPMDSLKAFLRKVKHHVGCQFSKTKRIK